MLTSRVISEQLQAEEALQAYHKALLLHNLANSQQNARHVAVASQGVVPEGENLPGGAKDHFVMGTASSHPYAVDAYSVHFAATGPSERLFFTPVAQEVACFSYALGQG